MSNSQLGESGVRKARSAWSPKEDEMLRKLVTELGCSSWSLISKGMAALGFDTRHAKSCRLRWCNELSVPKLPITPEEEALLDQLVEERGRKWSELAKHPGLCRHTDNHLKNNWYGRQARLKKLLASQGSRVGSTSSEGMTGSDRDVPPSAAKPARKQQQQQQQAVKPEGDSCDAAPARARRASRRACPAVLPESCDEGETESDCPMLFDTAQHDDQQPRLINLPQRPSSKLKPESEARVGVENVLVPQLHGYPRAPLTAPNVLVTMPELMDPPYLRLELPCLGSSSRMCDAGNSSACSSPGKQTLQQMSFTNQPSPGGSREASGVWGNHPWSNSATMWTGSEVQLEQQQLAGRRSSRQSGTPKAGEGGGVAGGEALKRSNSSRRSTKLNSASPAMMTCSLSSSLTPTAAALGDQQHMITSRPPSGQLTSAPGMQDWSGGGGGSMQPGCKVGGGPGHNIVALGGDDNIADLVDRLEAELAVDPTLDVPRTSAGLEHPPFQGLPSWPEQLHQDGGAARCGGGPQPKWLMVDIDNTVQNQGCGDSPSPRHASWSSARGSEHTSRDRQAMLNLPVISVPPPGGHRTMSCSPLALSAQRMLASSPSYGLDMCVDRARLTPMSAPGSNSMSLMHERWRSQQHRMSTGYDGPDAGKGWSQRLPVKRSSESRMVDPFIDPATGILEAEDGILSRPASRSRPSTVQDDFPPPVALDDPFSLNDDVGLGLPGPAPPPCQADAAMWADLPAPFERANHSLAMDCDMGELQLPGPDGTACLYHEDMMDANMGCREPDTLLLAGSQSCPGRLGAAPQPSVDLSLTQHNHLLLSQAHSMQPGLHPPSNFAVANCLGSRINALMPLGPRLGAPPRPVSRLARASHVGSSQQPTSARSTEETFVAETDLLIAAD